jgi:hypothetical protein
MQVKSHRLEIMRSMTVKDFRDPEKIDDGIKDAILRQKGCPEAIVKLSKERPSVYDLLASTHRYKPELIELQRNIIKKVSKGKLSKREGYYECFKGTLPNSSQIIRDLQKEAMANQSKPANSVNME